MKATKILAAFVLVMIGGCSSAQDAAAVDTQWDGACFQRAVFADCFRTVGEDARVCWPGAPTFTRAQAMLRVKLAGERLDRLGMTCDGWQP